MLSRRLCLQLWSALAFLASLLGLLPVRGWPLRSTPWPRWAAYSVMLTHILLFSSIEVLNTAIMPKANTSMAQLNQVGKVDSPDYCCGREWPRYTSKEK